MLRAVFSGNLCTRNADVADPQFWTYVQLAIRHTQDADDLSLLKLRLMQHLSVADYNTDSSQFSHHWDEANKLADAIISIQQPWAKVDEKSRAMQLMEQYKSVFGDPNDPEVAAEIQALRDAWQAEHERLYGE